MTADRTTVHKLIQYLRDIDLPVQRQYADAVVDLLGEIDERQNPPQFRPDPSVRETEEA